jgi:peptidyl-prolyl cis-trans isomerase SurA
MKLKTAVYIAIGILAATTGSFAQSVSQGQTLDKIVAIVGREIIMKSDLDAQMQVMKQMDTKLDINDPEKRKIVLNMLIDENLVIMKAIEDSIEVTEEELENQWNYWLQRLIENYGSKERIENIYHKSIDNLKFQYRDIIKKQLLGEHMTRRKLGTITISAREVREFYEQYKDSIPTIPAKIELYHIVRNVEVKGDVKEDLRAKARKIRDSILAGGDFEDFAKRYSADTYSGANGGDLGWVNRNKFYPEFEKAAFTLQKGEISSPVETPFGFHIIQSIEKKDDAIHVRHILLKFEDTETNKLKAVEFLKELKAKIDSGAKFEDLAHVYSDETETKGFGGKMGKFPVPLNPTSMFPYDFTPSNLDEIIAKMKTGDVSQPMPYKPDPKPSFRIIYKKSFVPEHKPDIDNDYEDLEKIAKNFKQRKLQQEWVNELRKQMYWEIKENF